MKKLGELLEKLDNSTEESFASSLLQYQIIDLLDTQNSLREKRLERRRIMRETPEYKEKRREYIKRPEVKIKMKEYRDRPEVKEKINKSQNLRYHNGKPVTLEYSKKKAKECYHNNDEYRANKLKDQKEYYHNNVEYFREHSRKPKIVEWRKEYNKRPEVVARNKKWHEDNKEKTKETNKKWAEKNKEKISLRNANKNRKKHGFDPAVSLEQHHIDKKQYWYKKVVYANQGPKKKENKNELKTETHILSTWSKIKKQLSGWWSS